MYKYMQYMYIYIYMYQDYIDVIRNHLNFMCPYFCSERVPFRHFNGRPEAKTPRWLKPS